MFTEFGPQLAGLESGIESNNLHIRSLCHFANVTLLHRHKVDIVAYIDIVAYFLHQSHMQ